MQANEKLYEGLIQSYSVNDVIRGLHILNKNHNLNIKYSYRDSDQNRSLPYINIVFKKDEPEIKDKVVNFFNTCGWYIIDIVTKDGISYKERKNIKNYNELFNINHFVFRAKFDTEIDPKNWPEYLYHVTPEVFFKKIIKNGLKPKSLGKNINHEEHIYLFDYLDNEETLNLIINLHKKRKISEYEAKPNIYILLKIDIYAQHGLTKLYVDPDLFNGYFTLNNIYPQSISKYKEIDLNKI